MALAVAVDAVLGRVVAALAALAVAVGGPRRFVRRRASRGSHVPRPRDGPRRRGAGVPPCDAPLIGCAIRRRDPLCLGDDRPTASPAASGPASSGLPRRRGLEPPAPGVLGAGAGGGVRRPALDGGARPRRRAAGRLDRHGRAVALRSRRGRAGEVRGGDHLLRGPALLLAPRGGSPGPRPRGATQREAGPRGERRQHAHHAGRAPLAEGPAAHVRREGDRGHPRPPPHAVAFEAAGAGPLRRLRSLRGQHGGARRGGLALLRPRRAAAVVGRDRDARGVAERPRAGAPGPQPGPSPREAEPPPRGPSGERDDRRDDRGAGQAGASAARPGAPSHAGPPPRRAHSSGAADEALPRGGCEPLGAHDPAQGGPGTGERGPRASPGRPGRERRPQRGRAGPRHGDGRGAGLRRQPLAARGRGARRARGRDPGAPQHGQPPEAAPLRVDARGGRGPPRAARARRADPHRLVPPGELRPRPCRGGARRPGPGPVAQRAGRAHAARARRRPLLRRAASPGGHDAHAAGRALRPRAHPRRGRGDAVGRDRRLRRPRALGARLDPRGGAGGLLPADVLRGLLVVRPHGCVPGRAGSRRSARPPAT